MRYFIFFTISLVSGFIYGQIYCPTNDSFTGNVKNISTNTYSKEPKVLIGIELDSLTLTESSIAEIQYGRVVQKSIFYKNGNLKCRCTKNYNTINKLVNHTTFAHDNAVDRKIIYTWKFERLIKTEYFNRENQMFSTIIYERDSIHYFIRSKEVFDGEIDNHYYTELNESYLPIRRYSIDKAGNKLLFEVTEYDTLNRIKKKTDWNNDKSRFDMLIFSYDSLDRFIAGKRYNQEGTYIGADSLVYDQYSNVIFSHLYDSYSKNWTTRYFNYEYDNYGNYIVKKEWVEHFGTRTLVLKEKREIIYTE